EGCGWPRARTDAEARLFLRGFGRVEQRHGLLRLFFLLGWRRSHIECEREALCSSRVESRALLCGWSFDELDCGCGFRRREVAEHGREFKLGEEFAAGLDVGTLS